MLFCLYEFDDYTDVSVFFLVMFFVNDTATTEIYTYGHTLSLHDALPIYPQCSGSTGCRLKLKPVPASSSSARYRRRRRYNSRSLSLSESTVTSGSFPRTRLRRTRQAPHIRTKIGRASCRERVCQYV